MTQKLYQFCISALSYWLVANFAGQVLDVPEKVVSIAAFIPPILGFMWGVPAAVGIYAGALLVIPEVHTALETGNWLLYFARGTGVMLAALLPSFLWRRLWTAENRCDGGRQLKPL